MNNDRKKTFNIIFILYIGYFISIVEPLVKVNAPFPPFKLFP